MREFEKPIVVISKCLGFEACRYNGAIIEDSVVERLIPFVHVITVCPEVEIGLGTPRQPIRLIRDSEQELRLIQPSTEMDYTEKMLEFSNSFLHSLDEVDGFILKNRSPSCAIKDAKIYGENEIVIHKEGGMFGRLVTDQFGHLALEDEGRLKNEQIRESFLTKLFMLADFRAIKKTGSLQSFIAFQSKNKYLFMALDQVKQKELGRIVANQEKRPIAELIQCYERALHQLLAKPCTRGTMTNALLHIFGYFSKQLTQKEKAFFLTLIEKYKAYQLPLSSPLAVLQAWTIRFQQEYLLQQTIFEPYPEELA